MLKWKNAFFPSWTPLNTYQATLIVIDEADVDSSNPEILTVQEEEDGNEDDYVQIDI